MFGLTAYDMKLRLSGLLPAVVFQAQTAEPALDVLEALRRRGHGALAIDTDEVTPSATMVRLKRFAIEGARLRADDRGDATPLADVTALIRASTSTDVVRATREREPVYSGRSFAPATREVEHLSHDSVVDHVLYVFRREGPPWILVEREAKYVGLGAALRSTRFQNFLATIELLRLAAPGAVYDARFAPDPHQSGKLVMTQGAGQPDPRGDNRLDVLVHALARWLTRPVGGPYRAAPSSPERERPR
jgi:hypothetical protein